MNKNKIPTADSILTEKIEHYSSAHAKYPKTADGKLKKAFIEFAKLHVEAALEAAAKTKLGANYIGTGLDEERYPNDKSLILNAYPLKKIK